MHVLYAEQEVGNIDMIATSPLSDGQLSAALDQQVKSPNRVFSTPACYAAVSVGFPDCVNICHYVLNVSTAFYILFLYYMQYCTCWKCLPLTCFVVYIC